MLNNKKIKILNNCIDIIDIEDNIDVLFLKFKIEESDILKYIQLISVNLNINHNIKKSVYLLCELIKFNNPNNLHIIKSLIKNLIKAELMYNLNTSKLLLKYAAEYGNLEIVKLLLKINNKNDNYNIDNKNDNYIYNFSIKVAAQKGYYDIVKLLIENDKFIIENENLALIEAACNGHYNIVKLLINDGRFCFSYGDNTSTLKYSAINGHYNIVELLLKDQRVNPADDNNYAINLAAENGHINIVELLLKDKRVNPDHMYGNLDPIERAIKNGHIDIVKLLLEDDRVNPNKRDTFASAVYSGNYKMIELLYNDKRIYENLSKDITQKSIIEKVNTLLYIFYILNNSNKKHNELLKEKDLYFLFNNFSSKSTILNIITKNKIKTILQKYKLKELYNILSGQSAENINRQCNCLFIL